MSFRTQAVVRQQAAIFDRLGDDAAWDGVAGTVRVRLRESDEDLRLDYGELIARGRTIKVRKSEVAAPTEGQAVQLLDDNGDPVTDDGAFVVAGEPKLDRRGVWSMPVRAA
jgi:hypothetical protein